MGEPIPESHGDLLVEPVHGVLTTVMPDGQPQNSIVWVDYDGQHVLVNTTLERQKGRNMRANPRVTLLVIDPRDGSRWIEVRGTVVEMTAEGAEAHADRLTRLYTGKRHFYGDIYPVEQRERETRVIVKILPLKVAVDAIFR
ncbi:MAG: PPOX class F420-dependent oxidoreductase [Chloroflexi bacterium]|nr:PPOX class F420-dependent oxidoreductase [Chloroflexota bacterium]